MPFLKENENSIQARTTMYNDEAPFFFENERDTTFSLALIILELGISKKITKDLDCKKYYKECKKLFIEEMVAYYKKTLKNDDKENFSKFKTVILDCFNEKRPNILEIYQKLLGKAIDIRENILKEDRWLNDVDIERLIHHKNLIIRSPKNVISNDEKKKVIIKRSQLKYIF